METKKIDQRNYLLKLCLMALFFSLFGFSQNSYAQNIEIKGAVKDGDGLPLPGVSVLVRGTTNGTQTDFDGNYTIGATKGDVLVFSYIGMKSQSIAVADKTNIDVVLQSDSQALDEVVVVGYGTVKKSNLTGSVSSIGGDEVKEFPTTSVDQAIQARASGVQVTQASSAPGGGVTVRIRGSNSVNSGSEPLYVIDGFPVYPNNTVYGSGSGNRQAANVLSTINPSDIASVEVLKDASATAIYGSRGSNGVVLVTTKRGKDGKAKINYESSYSIETLSNSVNVLDGSGFATYINALDASQGGSPRYSQAQIDAFGEGTDWFDIITRNGTVQNHQLTVSGGNETQQYAISGNFHQTDGLILRTDFTRAGIRLNLDNSVFNGNLKINSSWAFNRTVSNNAPTDRSGGGNAGIITTALGVDPTVPLRDENGKLQLASFDGRFSVNPLQELRNAIDRDVTTRLLGTSGITVKIFPVDGLLFKTSIGADILNLNRTSFSPDETTRNGRDNAGELTLANRSVGNILSENLFSYTKVINDKHFIDAIAGYTYQREINTFNSSTVRALAASNVNAATLQGGAIILTPFSDRKEWTLLSFLSRVNYGFSDRYLASFTIRRDGSSRFGKGNLWANFPSVAVGWRVSNEKFFKDSKLSKIVNEIKIRGSWGETGNSEIPVFNSLANLTELNFVFGNKFALGLADGRLENPDLRWETTTSRNVGIDFGLLKNRFTLTADYFFNTTNDLILNVSLPTSLGFQNILKNSGSLTNKGFEFAIDGDLIDNDKFKWSFSGNLSVLRNKLTSLGESTPFFADSPSGHLGIDGSYVAAGNPIGVWRGFKFTGIFQTQEEIDNNPSRSGDKPGYPRYQDTNKDGQITPDDFVIIGNPNPDYTWAFTTTINYKKFDLSVFVRGVMGFDVRNLQKSELGDGVQKLNQIRNILRDSWTPTNTGARRPIIDGNRDFANSLRDSDFFIEDGTFIRLQNLSLGYSLPASKFYASKARVYVSAQNLFIITDYTGFDPEVNNRGQDNLNKGDDFDAFPRAKTFTLGLSLEF